MIGAYVLRKLACPDGRLAGLFGSLLNRSNARLNAAVLAKLPTRSQQILLDVGFGGGVGIDLALADSRVAHVAGIDPSQAMVKAALRRHRDLPPGKSVDIHSGVAEHLPWNAEGRWCPRPWFTRQSAVERQ